MVSQGQKRAARCAIVVAGMALLGCHTEATGQPLTLAGMRPAPSLTDIARTRLEVISFFVLAFLLMALPVKWAWNYLRRDFIRLPRITYLRSLGLVTLWGLLFIIVLAMISGARELMTPGAWEKKPSGGYRLADAPDAAASENTPEKRRAKLERLYATIERYRAGHHGRYPAHDFVPEITSGVWESPHPSRQRYVYAVPAHGAAPQERLLAYEPACYGERRLILRANGSIEEMHERDAFYELRMANTR